MDESYHIVSCIHNSGKQEANSQSAFDSASDLPDLDLSVTDTSCSPLTHIHGTRCDLVSANSQREDDFASDLPNLDFTSESESESESECDACVSVSDDSASDLLG